MPLFIRELLGGVVLMIVASAVGIAVNAMRPDGIPLIQRGAAVETVQQGDVPSEAAGDTSAAAAENLPEGVVSLSEVKRMVDTGGAIIIDARSSSEYDEGHIPGAINVPHDRIPDFMDVLNSQVPMDADVICYCRGPDCDFSDLLATELKVMGYPKVSVFSGGWEHWLKAGYPTEAGPR